VNRERYRSDRIVGKVFKIRVSQSQSTGFNIILAATGALAVVGVVIKQVYEGGTLPVGAGGVSDTGFLLAVGVVLAFWSVAVLVGLTELAEVSSDA